jgi:hypothetical protein
MTDLSRRIASCAAAADPAALAEFEPTGSHLALLGALSEGHGLDSAAEIAEAAGLARSTAYGILADPAACSWLSSRLSGRVASRLGLVHARLFHLAMTSRSPAAIRLFLERFDPDYKPAAEEIARVAAGAVNAQFNFLQSMSPEELAAFVEQKRQRVLGATVLPA